MGQWAEGEPGPDARVVGREPELAVLSGFLAEPAVRALVVRGEPGIGKTALWEAGVGEARKRELRVLSARPSGVSAAPLGDVDTVEACAALGVGLAACVVYLDVE